MGVPGFFIWLAKRYPKIITDAFEKGVLPPSLPDPNAMDLNLEEEMQPDEEDGEEDPYKVTKIDNLYLDMNGIIHPCCHPQDAPQPKSQEEMFKNVEVYVNKLIRIVKPRKLIYFAIDGVAPRAKMNQQRSRRFRSALESTQRDEKEEKLREEWKARGLREPPLAAVKSTFDSNVITPGTEFMHRLSQSLQKFIQKSLLHDQNWQGLKIIFSDAQVPGEGEHKLLEFIRSQRAQPDYDANLRHCIYGADADLIMLALSTHEAHFYIIREVFLRAAEKECSICKRKGHLYFECEKSQGHHQEQFSTVLFQYIQISILRQYIEREYSRIDVNFEFDLERTIDDIVLLLFLCGNDFLPHLPSLRIAEGAIDALFFVYKLLLPKLGGYLTKNGDINLARMVYLLKHVGQVEQDIFKERLFRDDKFREKRRFYRKRDQDQLVHSSIMQGVPGNHSQPEAVLKQAFYISVESEVRQAKNDEQNEAVIKKMFEQRIKDTMKVSLYFNNQEESEEVSAKYEDKVRLGAAGWKERYYFDKFGLQPQQVHPFMQELTRYYLEGLSWVYQYYYQGCPSWSWYFPYHYAPFCSDLNLVSKGEDSITKQLSLNNALRPTFEKSKPYLPFEQLMSVLPAKSAHALPSCLRSFLLQPETSEIADFYPNDIVLDMNGHRHSWKGVNLIPFIDEDRLREAVAKREGQYAEQQEDRNLPGFERVYFAATAFVPEKQAPNSLFSQSFFGQLVSEPLPTFSSEVLSFRLKYPEYRKHIPRLLASAERPARSVVSDYDIENMDRRPFYGDNAIGMVKRALGITHLPQKPEYLNKGSSIRVEETHHSSRPHFSHSYNNNRGIAPTPTLHKIRGRDGGYHGGGFRGRKNRERSRDAEREYTRPMARPPPPQPRDMPQIDPPPRGQGGQADQRSSSAFGTEDDIARALAEVCKKRNN